MLRCDFVTSLISQKIRLAVEMDFRKGRKSEKEVFQTETIRIISSYLMTKAAIECTPSTVVSPSFCTFQH